MNRILACFILNIFVMSMLLADEPPANYEKYWPQWRGPHATGVAPQANPPIEWSENKNIRWKIEIFGRGHASPIVWQNQVFVLTAIETDQAGSASTSDDDLPAWRRGRGNSTDKIHEFVVLVLDRQNGRTLWQKTARAEVPHEGTHTDGTWASNSPVTDGEHVFAYFGSRGLYCYDMQGDLQWEKDLGDMQTRHGFGEGSSPVLYGDKIVVNWDHEGQSFIVALNKNSGDQLWKVERDERTSWSTPIIVEHEGRPQVVVSATNRVRAYDLESGEQIWESSGMTVNTIPSPVHADGVVYVMSGFRGSALQAIRLADAQGKVNDSNAMIWSHDRDTPYVPSPLLYGDYLYFLKVNSGILSCFNARTGDAFYGPQRLDDIDGIYASPVGASDRVYIVGRNGTTLVIKNRPEFEVLAQNELEDGFEASPAVVDKELFLRGRKFLYCIAAN